MVKAAIIVLAGTDTHADRAVNALQAAKEFSQAGDDVERVESFDGHPSVRELVADGYEVVTY